MLATVAGISLIAGRSPLTLKKRRPRRLRLWKKEKKKKPLMLVCECVHMISGAGFGYVTLDLIVAQHSKRRGED